MMRLFVLVLAVVVANADEAEFASFCEDMLPFCTESGDSLFGAGRDTIAEEGIDYGCLSTRPNPAWYYMMIEDSGDMDIDIASANNEDVDFAMWGSFDSISAAQEACGSGLGSPIDCSYSAQPTEIAKVRDAATGRVYVFVITNYANVENTIVFSKADNSGSATTNCDVLLTCDYEPFDGFSSSAYTSTDCYGAKYLETCSVECSSGYRMSGTVEDAYCDSGVWIWNDQSGSGNGCFDIDECAENSDDCGDNSYCVNTDGSFTCECNSGYYQTGSNPFTCSDIDECATGDDDCGDNSYCTNTAGSYYCTCDVGYEQTSSNPYTCSDIDECANGSDKCGDNAFCVNNDGGYTCSCNAGYEPIDEYNCADIDECAAGTYDCPDNSVCVNTDGGYYCECLVGYDGPDCEDIDECAEGLDECSEYADCINTDGAYECECWPDYTGDGFDCEAMPSASPSAMPVEDEGCVNEEEVYSEVNIQFAYIFRGLKVEPDCEDDMM